MSTYHVTTSDKALHHIKGLSAAEAICKALERNRGLTVVGCYAGNTDVGYKERGRIDYEIPPHKPIPPDEDLDEDETS